METYQLKYPCRVCGEVGKEAYRHQGRICKGCQLEYVRTWKKEHPGRKYVYRIKKKYGLTLDEVEVLLQKQKTRCSICKKKFNLDLPRRQYHIDHDRQTGRVRGILCFSCNTAIGLLHHEVKRVVAAYHYLKA